MAKNLRVVKFDEFGNLINEDCAGNIVTYENPCGCGDGSDDGGTTQPPPVVWTETKCRVAHGIKDLIFTEMLPDIVSGINVTPLVEPTFSAMIHYWMSDKGLVNSLYPGFYEWAVSVKQAGIAASALLGLEQALYVPLAVCTLLGVMPESAQISAAVVDEWQVQLETLRTGQSADMWTAAIAFLEVFPLDLIQKAAFDASANPLGEYDCTSCSQPIVPCGDAAGFTGVVYDWDNVELSGTPACYANGQYTTCSPSNSKEISGGNFTLTFDQATCISVVQFSIAGNGQVAWNEVKIIGVKADDSNIELGVVPVIQRTKCFTEGSIGKQYSATLQLPNPVSVKMLIFAPTKYAGNAAAPQHLHCVRVVQAAQVPAFVWGDPPSTITSAISAAPAGSLFFFEGGTSANEFAPGVYNLGLITPKSGDSFIGMGATPADVVFNGAKLINPTDWTWKQAGIYQYAYSRTLLKTPTVGSYTISNEAAYPRADWNISLLVDDAFAHHRAPAALADLLDGEWTYDETGTFGAAGMIYWRGVPANHITEVTDIEYFAKLNTGITNVTFKNCTIRGFASKIQRAAIYNADPTTATGMRLENVVLTLNDAVGVKVGAGAVLKNVIAEKNGQAGITGQGNVISFDKVFADSNNRKHTNLGFEACGWKIAFEVEGFTVTNSHANDNYGHGGWMDTNVRRILSRDNEFRRNFNVGEFYELCEDIESHDNIYVDNQGESTSQPWDAGLLITNCKVSTYAENKFYNHKIVVPDTGTTSGGGWGIVQSDRHLDGNSSETGTEYLTEDNHLYNCHVYHRGQSGRSGMVANYQQAAYWAAGNSVDHNYYHVRNTANQQFQSNSVPAAYSVSNQTFAQFQAIGQETGSTIDTATVPAELEG